MTERILIVDDCEDIRDFLAASLQAEGYSVVTAANGAEALDELRGTAPPSVMLLDLEMPVMSGWQVLTEVGEDPKLASVQIIVVSGSKVDLAKVPAAGVFTKPIEWAPLRDLVAKLVSEADPERSPPRVSAPMMGRVDAAEAHSTVEAEPLAAAGSGDPRPSVEVPAAAEPTAAAGEKIGDP